MKKDRRWLKAAIAASASEEVRLPWHRDNRRKPASLVASAKEAQQDTRQANAAR
jgi:hypothetical protein